MKQAYELITHLTSPSPPWVGRERMLNDFAYTFGWQPSDTLDAPLVAPFSNAHLIVEHGLENTAVISFLRSDRLGKGSYQGNCPILLRYLQCPSR